MTTFRSGLVFSGGLLFGLLAVSALPANSQGSGTPLAPSRVTSPINERSLVALPGNVHPFARTENDAGPAPVSMKAERLMLILKRSQQQEADLTSFLQRVQDPHSENFRKFLTPEQFGQ
jgi:hypothetical protein